MFQHKATKVVIAILIFLLVFLLLRNSLLRIVFSKIQQQLQHSHHLLVHAASLEFVGLDEVEINKTTVQPTGADTLVYIEKLVADFSITDLLCGKIWFDKISATHINITALDTGARNNLIFFRKTSNRVDNGSPRTSTGLLNKAAGYQQKLLKIFSTDFDIRYLLFTYTDSIYEERIFIPTLSYNQQQLTGSVIYQNGVDTLQISGEVIKKNEAYNLLLLKTGNKNDYLPFFNAQQKVKCSFKELEIKLAMERSKRLLKIKADIRAEQLIVNHWRIANSDVMLQHLQLKSNLKITDQAIEIDSATTAQLNHVTYDLFLHYQTKPTNELTVKLQMPFVSADTFFNSLPKGMFGTLNGISCTGSLAYSLLFHINTTQPDSLVFSSYMERKNFTVRHYGKENYGRIAGPFEYKAYDKKQLVRTIEVSPQNPHFTSLNAISPFLIKSVLQSEDPSFMLHRGFLPEAFRESIIKNYKEKRFARGGSTISMQLVKNIFLSRDKTISRKAEEALIVYIMENLHLVSKERMLEVYLNVIEWGPNVYGIGEAAQFYFSKKPSELSLQQSIFLAAIIPAPKFFKYQFDKTGKLKPYLNSYFHTLGSRMAVKGWISQSDTAGLLAEVQLRGPAIKMILPNDSVPLIDTDSEE